jgi:hypothetical protein
VYVARLTALDVVDGGVGWVGGASTVELDVGASAVVVGEDGSVVPAVGVADPVAAGSVVAGVVVAGESLAPATVTAELSRATTIPMDAVASLPRRISRSRRSRDSRNCYLRPSECSPDLLARGWKT